MQGLLRYIVILRYTRTIYSTYSENIHIRIICTYINFPYDGTQWVVVTFVHQEQFCWVSRNTNDRIRAPAATKNKTQQKLKIH